MNFSINQLNSLEKLISTNPNEAKALLKLTSVDVLKSLGDGKYTVVFDGKSITAQSDKPLREACKYWTQLTHLKNSNIKLSNLIKMPDIFQQFTNRNIEYSIKDLQTILNSKSPITTLKQNLLEILGNSSTKDEFTSASTLLLSLQNQTFTIPLNYHNYFSILQFKKRYNKKNNRTQIDFYAALELLGPISGVVTLENGDTSVNLNVAFKTTKTFLENDMNNFSHTVNISIIQNIEPLYNNSINSILDVSI